MRRAAGLVVVAIVIASCRNPNAARSGANSARSGAQVIDQQLSQASRFGQQLPELLDDRSHPVPSRSTIEAAAAAMPAENQTARDAVDTLAWDVFCEVVTGEAPADTEELGDWILDKAEDLALNLIGIEEAIELAESLLVAADDDTNAKTDACKQLRERLRESGL